MHREIASLTVELPDGTIARVVKREEGRWIVEKPGGEQIAILPPGHTTETEVAATRVVREKGS